MPIVRVENCTVEYGDEVFLMLWVWIDVSAALCPKFLRQIFCLRLQPLLDVCWITVSHPSARL